jgi:hypothetical protein
MREVPFAWETPQVSLLRLRNLNIE